MADLNVMYAFLGAYLRKVRQSRGVTQEQLAREIGVSRMTVTNIELGKHNVFFHTVMQMCLAIGVDPAEVVTVLIRENPGVFETDDR